MRISHKVVYSVRVTTTLAQRGLEAPGRPVSGRVLAETDHLPPGFLDDILRALRTGGVLKSQRGGEGGWLLARAPETITVADVIRAVEGPLASVRGVRPHELAAAGEQEPFISLWIAVRAALRSVLEHVTLADLAAGELPAAVAALAADPDAWDDRPRGARAVSPTVEARPATPAPAKASVKTKAPAKAPNKRAGGPAR
ncbi:MAG: Rrf2 family transcriptional regulator [Ilumatobacteraceae bacterium]